MPQAEANVVSQNLLVSTLRKEISWCNKARLRGASTSRARAKVWAQLPGAGPRAWGCKLQGLGAPAWAGASRGLGITMTRPEATTGQWVILWLCYILVTIDYATYL